MTTSGARHVVIMGVFGSGKSAVGSALAARLGWRFMGTTGQYPRQVLIPGNMDDGLHHRDDESRARKDGVMSDDRDHTIATATVISEETPYGVRINAGGHALRGDEPVDRGGADSGPAPFGLLLSGLGACTAITLRMYAEHQSWPLAGVNVELTYVVKDRNTRWIDRLITLHGVDEDQRAKLAEIAEKTPVTRVVRAGTEIRTTTGTA
jgi:putative redox protein